MNGSRIEGHSIIEVLIVVALLAITISFAVPSWNDARNKRQLTSSAEQLAAFIDSARSQAIRHNRKVSISLQRSGPEAWCVGMSTGASGCDCTVQNPAESSYCAIGDARQVLDSSDLPAVVMTRHSEDTDLVFDPVRGVLLSQDAGRTHHFDLASRNANFGLRVGVSPVGNVFLCDWKQAGNNAYRACEAATGDGPENQGLLN